MNYNHLTDTEFRHYMELYNTDPIVQRLCRVEHDRVYELQDELEDARTELESAESDNDYLREVLSEIKRENRILKEKIQIWNTLNE